MTASPLNVIPDRQPWKAAVLSLLCTGLGHVYAGAVSRGLGLFLISLLATPLFVIAAHAPAATAWLLALAAAVLGVVVVYVVAVLDSYRQAAVRGHHAPALAIAPWVYGLFILVGLSYPVASAWLIRSAAFQAYVTAANSMAPTLEFGDRILVNRARPVADLRPGAVIVHRNPEDRSEAFVKRLIGLPGDTIAVEPAGVRVNGILLERDLVLRRADGTAADGTAALIESNGRMHDSTEYSSAPGGLLPPTTVPPGHCFVLGDNRSNSRDSRAFGPVPLGDVLGVAEYLFWPAGPWSRLGVVTPSAG